MSQLYIALDPPCGMVYLGTMSSIKVAASVFFFSFFCRCDAASGSIFMFSIFVIRFLTISHACLSSIPPETRRVVWSTWCPCSWDADWCLRFDVISDSRLQAGAKSTVSDETLFFDMNAMRTAIPVRQLVGGVAVGGGMVGDGMVVVGGSGGWCGG